MLNLSSVSFQQFRNPFEVLVVRLVALLDAGDVIVPLSVEPYRRLLDSVLIRVVALGEQEVLQILNLVPEFPYLLVQAVGLRLGRILFLDDSPSDNLGEFRRSILGFDCLAEILLVKSGSDVRFVDSPHLLFINRQSCHFLKLLLCHNLCLL